MLSQIGTTCGKKTWQINKGHKRHKKDIAKASIKKQLGQSSEVMETWPEWSAGHIKKQSGDEKSLGKVKQKQPTNTTKPPEGFLQSNIPDFYYSHILYIYIYLYICRYICMNDPNHANDTMIQTLFVLIYPKKNQINFLNKIHLY